MSVSSIAAPTSAVVSSLATNANKAVQLLTKETEPAALEFLSARPIHTVVMASFIRDNGATNDLNRGTFYIHLDRCGKIDGVALIGHVTLFETESDPAIKAFARLVRTDREGIRLIIGEEEKIKQLWSHLGCHAPPVAELRRELLFERRGPIGKSSTPFKGSNVTVASRPARLDDLRLVMATHARMAVEDFGLPDPLLTDPIGFAQRCVRRILQQRTWIIVSGNTLIFKADVVAETPEAVYLEGLYVQPALRGQGFGLKCLAELCRRLRKPDRSICLLVNERNESALRFYQTAGFQVRSAYTTVFISRHKLPAMQAA